MDRRPSVEKSLSRSNLVVLSVFAFALSGCVPDSLARRLRAWGVPVPVKTQFPESNAREEPLSAEELEKRRNLERVAEIYRVSFSKEPADLRWLASYAELLKQGASLEGIYNGWLRDNEYRGLENDGIGAPAEALEVAGRELALMESEMSRPKLFRPDDLKPQPMGNPMDESAPEKKSDANPTAPVATFGRPLEGGRYAEVKAGEKPDVTGLASRYSATFVGVNFFTLKRVMGDEAIRIIADKQEYGKTALAKWYGAWATEMASRGVDFGIEKRNLGSFEFHHGWALEHSVDEITWEVLNRLHRVMNQAAVQK